MASCSFEFRSLCSAALPMVAAAALCVPATGQQAGVAGTPGVGSRLYLGGGSHEKDKNYRTISGQVTDAKGKTIPNAMVYLKEVRTGTVQIQLADATGAYHFGPLVLNEDFQVWAQDGEKKTRVRPISQYNQVPVITMPLEFEAKPTSAPSAAASAAAAAAAAAATGSTQPR